MPLAAPPSEALEPPPWERRGLAFSTIVHPRADRASLSRLPCFTIAFTVLHYRVYRASLSRPRHDPTPDRPRPRQGGREVGTGLSVVTTNPVPPRTDNFGPARQIGPALGSFEAADLARRTWPGGPGRRSWGSDAELGSQDLARWTWAKPESTEGHGWTE